MTLECQGLQGVELSQICQSYLSLINLIWRCFRGKEDGQLGLFSLGSAPQVFGSVILTRCFNRFQYVGCSGGEYLPFDWGTCTRAACKIYPTSLGWFYGPPPSCCIMFLLQLPNGYGSIPINTIFRGMTIHKSQLFWCELQGYYWFWHTAK